MMRHRPSSLGCLEQSYGTVKLSLFVTALALQLRYHLLLLGLVA